MNSVGELAGMTETMQALPTLAPLTGVSRAGWQAVADAAVEPNGFYESSYSLPAYESAQQSQAARALLAYDNSQLIGVLPVVSAWQALRLPVPALVARQPYSPLTVPLLHRDQAVAAAGALIDAARAAGARVLSLPAMTLDGAAAEALTAALTERGIVATVHGRHERGAFDATSDCETYLTTSLGPKKLRDLRRQRRRLEDEGAVRFAVATAPAEIAPALERFMALEASGWKGAAGTGLGQQPGDAAFVRAAAQGLGARGQFEIVELLVDERTIASGIVIKQGDRAFYFKMAYDESLSRWSPGMLMTLEVTRLLSEDPAIRLVDSTADANHPLIDHLWRERLAVGDMLIPTRAGDKLAEAVIAGFALHRSAKARAKIWLARIKKSS